MLWQIHGEPKNSSLRFSTSGDNQILAAPVGTNMMIHALALIPSADTTIKIKLGARTVLDADLKAFMPFTMDDTVGMEGVGFWECKAGEAFIINLNGPFEVTGLVKYSYIDTTR